MNVRVPFNSPYVSGKEFEYIQEAIKNQHLSGDGDFGKRVQAILEQETGAKKALLVTSCTHALEMTALLLDIQRGDEVIVPSFTFVSTVNAFVLRGATPVFADIRPDTLNIDENQLSSLITPRTRAIVVVHYAGIACEMDTIMAIANANNIAVIEDNAHGLFAEYKGRRLGSIGKMATQSFHETKNLQCGEGGALLINDETLVTRAEIIREKGTNRARFFRGEIDKYTWVDIGSSYVQSDMLAAYLYAQFEARDDIQAKRKHIWDLYAEHLKAWAASNGVTIPTVPEGVTPAYHLFWMTMPTAEHRAAMISHLKAHNINSVFHYLPLHLSDMGEKFGGKVGDAPVTESVADRLLRLPFYNAMTGDELERVVDSVMSFEF